MKIRILIFVLSLFTFLSCKKPAGTGGNSTIKGTVWVQDYNKYLAGNPQYQYSGVDVEVYIIYGDDISAGDKVNTNANGEFEFKYLRKGKYTIYAIGKEKLSTATTNDDLKDVAFSLDVTVSKNKETVDAGQLTIKTE